MEIMGQQWVKTATNAFNLGGLIGTLLTIPAAKYLGRRAMFAIYWALSAVAISSDARWLLLTNLPASVQAATVALWYYWRWRIESFFKLLKGAGAEFEGKLITDSSWNDKQTVLDQLLYTVGQLNGFTAVGRVDGTATREIDADGLLVTFEGAKAPEPQLYDKVLVAVGRTPNGKQLNCEAAGVAVSERGFIEVDRQQGKILGASVDPGSTTLRDAHQSLLATRMRTHDMTAIAPFIAAHREELVLKASASRGGKGVVLGFHTRIDIGVAELQALQAAGEAQDEHRGCRRGE